MNANKKIELGKYLLGKGEAQRALEIFEDASHASPAALRAIAHCYDEGLGVKADPRRALKYQAMATRMERNERARSARRERNIRRAVKEGGHWLSYNFSQESIQEVRNIHDLDRAETGRSIKNIRPAKCVRKAVPAQKVPARKKTPAVSKQPTVAKPAPQSRKMEFVVAQAPKVKAPRGWRDLDARAASQAAARVLAAMHLRCAAEADPVEELLAAI